MLQGVDVNCDSFLRVETEISIQIDLLTAHIHWITGFCHCNAVSGEVKGGGFQL